MKDFFILPFNKEKNILFLPLQQRIFLIDSNQNSKFIKNQNFLKCFINKKNKELPVRNNVPDAYFTTLALELTDNCNLSCIYCYSKERRNNPRDMPWDTAKHCVDFCIKNLRCIGFPFELTFFGAGESSLNWSLLTKISEYAKKQCKKHKIKLMLRLGNTNGTTINTKEKIDWVIKNLESIQISLDGSEKIQNSNRPYRNGKGTYKDIITLMKKLKGRIDVGVRCTVNSRNVRHMKDLVKELKKEHLKIAGLRFGGSFSNKRRSKNYYAYTKYFFDEYQKAKKEAKKNGINITTMYEFSLNKPQIFHCGINGKVLYVTSRGILSLCPVGTNMNNLNNPFIIGRYDTSKKRLIINKQKILKIQKRTADRIKGCQNCFAKYYCAGECPGVAYLCKGSVYKIGVHEKCHLYRKFIYNEILENLSQGSKDKKEASFLNCNP